MILLVSMRQTMLKNYPEPIDAISHDWLEFFNKKNITPIFISNKIDDLNKYFDLNPQGLLLTGGNDLNNPNYILRDHQEYILITKALELNLPIMGVCRGLQIINQFFKGSLSELNNKSHVAKNHNITILPNDIIKSKNLNYTVNSFHDYAVKKTDLAKELIALAECDDIIEALYSVQYKILAVQWHFERNNKNALELDNNLQKWWFSLCN